MGEHTSRSRGGLAPRLAVAAGCVVAGVCAWLLVAGRLGAAHSADPVPCELCAEQGPAGAISAGTVPSAAQTHAGRDLVTGSEKGSATPPASSRTTGGASGSSAASVSSVSQPAQPSQSTPSPSSSLPSPSAPGVAVSYTVTSQWSSGYRVQVTLRNTSQSTVTSWNLVFRAPGVKLAMQPDGAVASAAGDVLTARPVSWDGTIAPGGSVDLGFMFDGPWVPATQALTGCRLDGVPCVLTEK